MKYFAGGCFPHTKNEHESGGWENTIAKIILVSLFIPVPFFSWGGLINNYSGEKGASEKGNGCLLDNYLGILRGDILT